MYSADVRSKSSEDGSDTEKDGDGTVSPFTECKNFFRRVVTADNDGAPGTLEVLEMSCACLQNRMFRKKSSSLSRGLIEISDSVGICREFCTYLKSLPEDEDRANGMLCCNVLLAINYIFENEQVTFSYEGKHFDVHRNKKRVSHGFVQFFYAKLLTDPRRVVYPPNTSFWQNRYDQYRGRFKPRQGKKRACQEDEQNPTRPIKKAAQDDIGLIQAEVVNTSASESVSSESATSESASIESSASESSASESIAEPATTKRYGRHKVKDVTLPNGHVVRDVPGNYKLVHDRQHGMYEAERAIVNCMRRLFSRKEACPTEFTKLLRRLFSRKEACPTEFTKLLHAAFASAYPTVPTETQQVLISLSRFTLMLEMREQLRPEEEKYRPYFDQFIDIDKTCDISASARATDGYTDNLAILQAMNVSYEMSKPGRKPFCQSDGGPDGSLAQLITWVDPDDKSDTPVGSIKEFLGGS
jgi:hypothetical protein